MGRFAAIDTDVHFLFVAWRLSISVSFGHAHSKYVHCHLVLLQLTRSRNMHGPARYVGKISNFALEWRIMGRSDAIEAIPKNIFIRLLTAR